MALADGADGAAARDEARRVVQAATYLTLATADRDGVPWATPLWFAERGLAELVWASRPGARHSRNIAARARVAVTVFDSAAAVGKASAVYARADAEQVAGDEVGAALAVFNARAQPQGIGAWTPEQVTGAAPLRLYRARITRLWVLDDHDGRVEVVSRAGPPSAASR